MSLIAGFDLSLNSTGVTIIDTEDGKPVHYESIASGLDKVDRLFYNYQSYCTIFSTHRDIEYIAFELQNPRMRFAYSSGNILDLAENVGVWKLSIYNSLPYFVTPPKILGITAQDIKKYATGNGNATKEEMIAAVNGNHIKSIRRDIPAHSVNDVADAYHLTRLVKSLIDENKYSDYLLKI